MFGQQLLLTCWGNLNRVNQVYSRANYQPLAQQTMGLLFLLAGAALVHFCALLSLMKEFSENAKRAKSVQRRRTRCQILLYDS